MIIKDNFAYFSIKTYVVGTNEYPQHMFLWRNKQNAQSDQCLCCSLPG